MRTNYQGFTLIELMIVLAIVGILMSVALPQYKQYVTKTNRTEAMAQIQQMLDAQERYYIDERTYTKTKGDIKGFKYSTDLYDYDFAECSNGSLQVCVKVIGKPKPKGAQAGDGDLWANSRGERSGNWGR